MSTYDQWKTEGYSYECGECGTKYTSADGGCTPCADWRADLMQMAIAKLEAMTTKELDEFAQGSSICK